MSLTNQVQNLTRTTGTPLSLVSGEQSPTPDLSSQNSAPSLNAGSTGDHLTLDFAAPISLLGLDYRILYYLSIYTFHGDLDALGRRYIALDGPQCSPVDAMLGMVDVLSLVDRQQ